MREHSDWLRVILGYKFLLKTSAHRSKCTDKCTLKTWRLQKKVHIVGLNDENIKQLIYLFGTDKGTNRPRNT